MAPAPKDESFLVRMDADERRMLRELGDADGLSEATVVRQLIRRAHADRFRAKTRTKPRAAKERK
jgi:hypothetical protein